MSAERVAIDRVELRISAGRGIDDPAAFGREVVAALERELDRQLPVSERTLYLPYVEVTLKVPRRHAELVEAIAAELASAIVREARVESAPAPIERMEALAQRLLRADRAPSTHSESGRALDIGLAELGALARCALLPAFVLSLSAEHARALALGVFAEFQVRSKPGAATLDVRSLALRACATCGVSDALLWGSTPAAVVLLAAGWAARLDPARVTSSPGWRKVFAREVGAVSEPDEEEPGALATLGDAPLSVPDSSLLGEVPHEPSDTLQPTLPTARRERLETEAGALAGTEPSERTFSFTCVAGLAFLLGPLRDLGIQAALHAIRNEPSLVLYDVLRAVLTRLEVECPAEDPAPWLLAGLFAAPSPDDLSDDVALWSVEECAALGRACGRECRDYREACDAWAEVVLEDIDARLTALSLGTDLVVPSAKDLMVLHGTFCSEPERLSVVLPFPASYEALLRAGLLADLRDVPWLGGRSLLFVFEESA